MANGRARRLAGSGLSCVVVHLWSWSSGVVGVWSGLPIYSIDLRSTVVGLVVVSCVCGRAGASQLFLPKRSTGSVGDWDNGRPGLQADKNYSLLKEWCHMHIAANSPSSSRSTIFKALKLLEQQLPRPSRIVCDSARLQPCIRQDKRQISLITRTSGYWIT